MISYISLRVFLTEFFTNFEKKKLNLLKEKIELIETVSKSLKEKVALQAISLDSALNSTIITDRNGKIIWVNKAFTKLTGYSYNEVIGRNPRILNSGVHSKEFFKKMWEVLITGKVWEGEITNAKKDGTIYHERIVITPVLNSKKKITNYIATQLDITHHKQTDKALHESYIKYEEIAYIFNQSPAVGFLRTEGEKRTVEFVTDNIKQWGYKPEDFYTQKLSFEDIIFEKDKEEILNNTAQQIANGKERLKQHFRIITKNNKIRWVDSHQYVRFAENDSVTHLQGVILDVTDRKVAEEEAKTQLEQLMQADKMIALGTLVSGVAHEINNPNNFVLLNIPLIEKVWFNILPILEDYYEKNGDFNVGEKLMYSKIKDSMPLLFGGINDGSKRIKNIVEDLKSFARKDTSGFNQNVDLNKVVQTSVNLTANLVSKSTDNFKVRYSPDPVMIKGNKQKLEQVLINLIENSCQALTKREQQVKIIVENKSNTASISISDEGVGMEANIVRNITDPFFTTKRNSGGTGLGLSIATKILMQHDGKLNFQTEQGNGTTATITLPLSNGE